ncbi:hypothetical protein [Streptomyces sp. SM11]|uniref:hypothetical protein n=1 Tax=Streptomyces sp. SM11 TaxID=565557 RepID=UPI000CD4FCBE|nr:hypothetical protein [Streptomyces sp. SM11]
MEARDHELKKELAATLQARGELGAEYETALIDSFLNMTARPDPRGSPAAPKHVAGTAAPPVARGGGTTAVPARDAVRVRAGCPRPGDGGGPGAAP